MARSKTAAAPAPEAPKHQGFRVYKFPSSVREGIKAKRIETNTTNAAVLHAAVAEKLPTILSGLAAIGVTGRIGEEKKAMRLKVGQETLDALKVAAAQCGLPATLLLTASLSLLGQGVQEAAPKARRGRKSSK